MTDLPTLQALARRLEGEDADSRTYEVTVWDLSSGNIERKLWRATEDDLREIESCYSDDELFQIIIEEND